MLTRRRVLGVGATVIASWIWASLAVRLWPARNHVQLSDPGSTTDGRYVALGRAYLQRYPDEALQSRLSRLVPADPVLRSRQVRDDFVTGQVVTLGGWILSRTECRFCALHVLADERQGRG